MPEKIHDAALLKEIIFDDADGYSMVKEIDEGGSRWHRLISSVFQRESDHKLFIMEWRRGSTEAQDHEWPDVAYEAEEHTETVVRYRVIPQSPRPKIITKGPLTCQS